MSILTENDVRQLHLIGRNKEIRVSQNTFITQLAKEYIKEKKLKLIIDKEDKINEDIRGCKETKFGYINFENGCYMDSKLEHMTHLHSNILVNKNHPRIIFRGKLDSFQAYIMDVEIYSEKIKLKNLTEDLQSIKEYIRHILYCEVSNKSMDYDNLIGLSYEELRKLSHNPKEHFGIGHLDISYTMGEMIIKLNLLRTLSRELEICAVSAFCALDNIEHKDILKALNRLSSTIYIIMYRYITNYYK